jgi:HAE1 family hydrophobic/amphiphilic exporter-1/multidrug efflux pump
VPPLGSSSGAGAGARHSAGTGVMGGMLAATFLAIFFIPWFFKLIEDRRLSDTRTTKEIEEEAARYRETVGRTAHGAQYHSVVRGDDDETG